jgi:aminoglycoside phosphotransferase (APT) family kinase protein
VGEIKNILSHIPLLQDYETATFVEKGFSPDEKWILSLKDGSKYFIKVCDINKSEHKKTEMNYMEHFRSVGVQVPESIAFHEIGSIGKCVQIFEYIEGNDGEASLPHLSELEQYQVGLDTGRSLKLIHTLKKPTLEETWESYRLKKLVHYQKLFAEMDYDKFPMDQVGNFIEKHLLLLKDRPVVFLHDDCHPANLMVAKGHLTSVIDFDRYEWGDPYHDFHKMALFSRNVSVPFSIGQVHGYFDGGAPLEFWKYYSLYAAIVFYADIVWSHRMDNVQQMEKRLSQIIVDHETFTTYKPLWYDTRSDYFLNQRQK